MLHSTQHDSSVYYMSLIAVVALLVIGLILSLGIGLLSEFGLQVIAVIAGIIFVALFIYEWTRP